ncbi:BTB/POZ domain-containing protein 6-like [Pecten maximus]|uniref:BTB/POZ domain-containing protein 6-like n=1 Tax=Pecten maximus TaxID=6579 RepID=UPI00145829E7|nr:BTB/POZ domain-containing protein 6-like [Pecten maximus]
MTDGTSSLPFQQAIGGAVHITKDWQSGKTLSESLEYAHTSGEAGDVTFIVGDDKIKISAHKMILAIRSPVFFAMLEGHLPEKGEITIPDIRGDIFKSFLRYLYTDTIDLTIENVVPVFSAARKVYGG